MLKSHFRIATGGARAQMTEAIVWKYATEQELARLSECYAVDDCKRMLGEIFARGDDRDSERNAFLLDFQFHNYSFCRQQLFSAEQTSALLGICHALMARDFDVDSNTALADSYAHFEALLLSHSVNRSPKSVLVFSPEQVASIVDFVTHTYFRHFELYKSIYTPHKHVFLTQREVNDVQVPRMPRPLVDGLLNAPPKYEAPVVEGEGVKAEQMQA